MGKKVDVEDELTVAQLALDAADEAWKGARSQGRDVNAREVKDLEKYMDMREKALARAGRK